VLTLLFAFRMAVVGERQGRLDLAGADAASPEPGATAAATGRTAAEVGAPITATATSDLFAALPTLPPPTIVPTAPVTVASPAAPATSPPSPTVPATRVGIVPGHWQYDSGAVCPDGLREVDVTTDVALRVKALLEYRGFDVDLLPEHEPGVPQPPILGYRGAAVVSVHADSCDVPGLSGFKVARGLHSTTPEADDRLVACLEEAYARDTLLPRNDDTITPNMWSYYAFRELDSATPAAIIELGFLNGDRDALDRLRYEMALGVADGVSCFLR
jgi:N-acetylmuramoyl-L-alanine amidase